MVRWFGSVLGGIEPNGQNIRIFTSISKGVTLGAVAAVLEVWVTAARGRGAYMQELQTSCATIVTGT